MPHQRHHAAAPPPHTQHQGLGAGFLPLQPAGDTCHAMQALDDWTGAITHAGAPLSCCVAARDGSGLYVIGRYNYLGMDDLYGCVMPNAENLRAQPTPCIALVQRSANKRRTVATALCQSAWFSGLAMSYDPSSTLCSVGAATGKLTSKSQAEKANKPALQGGTGQNLPP